MSREAVGVQNNALGSELFGFRPSPGSHCFRGRSTNLFSFRDALTEAREKLCRGGLALLLMFLVAVFGYGMPARAAVSATVLGVVSGLWPIGWIILTAVFFYNLTVEAGQSEVITLSFATEEMASYDMNVEEA